jgi:hypothetical protein
MTDESVQILILTGNKRSGKDTFVRRLLETRSGWETYAFAGPLKKGCQQFFMFSDEQLEDEILKEQVDEYWGFSPRASFQVVGTELMRETLPKYLPVDGEEMWVKRFKLWLNKKIARDRAAGRPTKVAISDGRFPNESEYVRIHVRNVTIIRTNRAGLDVGADKHKSESSVNAIVPDIIVENNGNNLQDYYEEIDNCLTNLGISKSTCVEKTRDWVSSVGKNIRNANPSSVKSHIFTAAASCALTSLVFAFVSRS